MQLIETKRTLVVEVTQYLRPNGRKNPCTTLLDASLEPNYILMQSRGLTFGAEELMTGMVSLTIEDLPREEDVQMRVVPNGPEVPAAMEDMLRWCTVENIDAYEAQAEVA